MQAGIRLQRSFALVVPAALRRPVGKGILKPYHLIQQASKRGDASVSRKADSADCTRLA